MMSQDEFSSGKQPSTGRRSMSSTFVGSFGEQNSDYDQKLDEVGVEFEFELDESPNRLSDIKASVAPVDQSLPVPSEDYELLEYSSDLVNKILTSGLKVKDVLNYIKAKEMIVQLDNKSKLYQQYTKNVSASDIRMLELHKNTVTTPPHFETAIAEIFYTKHDKSILHDGFSSVPYMHNGKRYFLNINHEDIFSSDFSSVPPAEAFPFNAYRNDMSTILASLIKRTEKRRENPTVCYYKKTDVGVVTVVLEKKAHEIVKRFNKVMEFADYRDVIAECMGSVKTATCYPSKGKGFRNQDGMFDKRVATEFMLSTVSISCLSKNYSVPIKDLPSAIRKLISKSADVPFMLEAFRSMRKDTILDDYIFKDTALWAEYDGHLVKYTHVCGKHVQIAEAIMKIPDWQSKQIHYVGLGITNKGGKTQFDNNYGAATLECMLHKELEKDIKFYNLPTGGEIKLNNRTYKVEEFDITKSLSVVEADDIWISDVMVSGQNIDKYLVTNNIHTKWLVQCLSKKAFFIGKFCLNSLEFMPRRTAAKGRAHNAEIFLASWMFVLVGKVLKELDTDNKPLNLCKNVISPEKSAPTNESRNTYVDTFFFNRNSFLDVVIPVNYHVVRNIKTDVYYKILVKMGGGEVPVHEMSLKAHMMTLKDKSDVFQYNGNMFSRSANHAVLSELGIDAEKPEDRKSVV